MFAAHKLYPQLKGSCKLNCGKLHGKWAIEVYGPEYYEPLDQCRMTEYHDFLDPRDGQTKEWTNP